MPRITVPSLVPALVLLLSPALAVAAAGDTTRHKTVTQVKVEIRKDDGSVERYHVNRHDDVTSEKLEDGRKWHRETAVRRSDGVQRDVVADGEVHRDGEGGGTRTVDRHGTVRRKGEEVEHDYRQDARWQANDEGGRDLEKVEQRRNSKGHSSHAKTQRRTSDGGDGITDFIEQVETSSSKHGQSVKWEQGQRKVTRLANGYEQRTTVKGWDDTGDRWTREHSRQVRKNADATLTVLDVTATKHRNDQPEYRVLQGTWTPLGNASEGRDGKRHWRFEGTLERRDGKRVTSTREIKREAWRLHIVHPDNEKAVEALGESKR